MRSSPMPVAFKNGYCRREGVKVFPSRSPAAGLSGKLLVAVVILLGVGVVSLSVLAKSGQFHPTRSFGKQISKSCKMSECRSPLIGAVPPAVFAVEAARLSDVSELSLLLSTRETFDFQSSGFSQENLSRPPPSC